MLSCSWTLLGCFFPLSRRETHQNLNYRMSNTCHIAIRSIFVDVVMLLLQNLCEWYSRDSVKTLTFPEPKWSHMSHEVEEDRAVVVKLGEAAVNSKIQHLCPGFAAGWQIRWLFSFRCWLTLPETNILVAPKDRPSKKERIVFQPSMFKCFCC